MFGEDRILVGSGGIGTALIERGLPIGVPSELWTKERAEAVAEVACEYSDAGADYVLTNTFGANKLRLAGVGLEDEVADLNVEAVRLARMNVRADCRVLASVGPCGGNSTRSDCQDAYREQVASLVDAGIDGFVVETICVGDEGASAVREIKAVCELPVAVSFAVFEKDDQLETVEGEPLVDLVNRFSDCGVGALGVNCVVAGLAVRALTEIAEGTAVPLIVHPNAGIPVSKDAEILYPMGACEIVDSLQPLLNLPVGMIGGCCGTGPEYVAAIRARIDALETHRQV